MRYVWDSNTYKHCIRDYVNTQFIILVSRIYWDKRLRMAYEGVELNMTIYRRPAGLTLIDKFLQCHDANDGKGVIKWLQMLLLTKPPV
jgi:hypothetical protein